MIRVTDEKDLTCPGNGFQQGGGEVDIQHGAFVNDDKIHIERMFLVSFEAADLPLQKPMDCFGFSADDIHHALGRPAGGGGKQDFLLHRLEQFHQNQCGRGFSAPGPPVSTENFSDAMPWTASGCSSLRANCFGAVTSEPILDPLLSTCGGVIRIGNSFGDVQLIEIEGLGIVAGFGDAVRNRQFADHDKPVLLHLVEKAGYPIVESQFEQFVHLGGNLRLRQVAVAELPAGGQDMIDAGPDSLGAVGQGRC